MTLGDNKLNNRPYLLTCPSSFPVKTSGTYTDCRINGTTSTPFKISSGVLTMVRCEFTNCIEQNTQGASIYCSGSTIGYIYSCSFVSCRSWYNGAGINYRSSDCITVQNSHFKNCSDSLNGAGAISIRGYRCIIENNIFEDCWADNYGGAIRQEYYVSIVLITKCKFLRCYECVEGGGAVSLEGGTFDVNECYFEKCTATNGGAISLYARDSGSSGSTTISRCEIVSCSASSKGGGAISVLTLRGNPPSLSVSYLIIRDCSAPSSCGQAIHLYECASFTWEKLCITGSGTLIASSSVSIPSASQLQEVCQVVSPTPRPTTTKVPTPSQSRSLPLTATMTDYYMRNEHTRNYFFLRAFIYMYVVV